MSRRKRESLSEFPVFLYFLVFSPSMAFKQLIKMPEKKYIGIAIIT